MRRLATMAGLATSIIYFLTRSIHRIRVLLSLRGRAATGQTRLWPGEVQRLFLTAKAQPKKMYHTVHNTKIAPGTPIFLNKNWNGLIGASKMWDINFVDPCCHQSGQGKCNGSLTHRKGQSRQNNTYPSTLNLASSIDPTNPVYT